ncbi:MAG: hypothetical protein ACK4NA_12840 [Alphaproteobacteria bacterium]
MTTANEAFLACKARLDGAALGYPVIYDNVTDMPLPDSPSVFARAEFVTDPGRILAYGGGRGGNTYRNFALFVVHVLVKRGTGLSAALTRAETVAALFRSYRTSQVSFREAWVESGRAAADGNYYVASAVCEFWFDQIG